MTDVALTRRAPLAWGQDGRMFVLPPEAERWLVKEPTGGKPRPVWGDNGPVYLGLDATMAELRRAVRRPGLYRLYPVDAADTELSPVAYVEVVPDGELEPLGPYHDTRQSDRMYDIADRLLTNRESQDLIIADMLKTLVTATSSIQQSTAALLTAANTTIKIANGVEALERQEPQIDIESLTAQLTESLAAEKKATPEPHWIMQLLSSPLGASAFKLLNDFVAGFAGAQQAAMLGQARSQATPPPSAAAPAAGASTRASSALSHDMADSEEMDEDPLEDEDNDQPEERDEDLLEGTDCDQPEEDIVGEDQGEPELQDDEQAGAGEFLAPQDSVPSHVVGDSISSTAKQPGMPKHADASARTAGRPRVDSEPPQLHATARPRSPAPAMTSGAGIQHIGESAGVVLRSRAPTKSLGEATTHPAFTSRPDSANQQRSAKKPKRKPKSKRRKSRR